MFDLDKFVRESNRSEGILRDPLPTELDATDAFISLPTIGFEDVIKFVSEIQPGAVLRERYGLDVRVGNHYPPKGAPEIRLKLDELLTELGDLSPYAAHVRYETLHPFTDGNGRSGRAIWLWQMLRLYSGAPLGFLHTFYYQSLQGARS